MIAWRTILRATGLSGRQTSLSMKLPMGLSPSARPSLPGRKWNGSQTRWLARASAFFGSTILCAEQLRLYRAPLSKRIMPAQVASSTYWLAWATVAAWGCGKPARRATT